MSTLKNILPVILCLFSSTLYAQAPNENLSKWNFKLGTGAMADSQAWKGIDTEVAIIPFIEASIGNWSFNVINPVTYKTEMNAWSSIYVGLSIRSEGYEHSDFAISSASDSIIFTGYEEPDAETVINYGASLGWLSIDASTDVSNNSESDTLSLSVEVPVYEGTAGFNISTSVSAHWMDSNYVNYYYGISGGLVDNSVGRSSYQTESAVNYEVSINAMYPLNQQWILIGELSHTLLADEISDSPLIDTNDQNALTLLAIYQF